MMTMGMPWANWILGMNDKVISPQARAPVPSPGVRYTGSQGARPTPPQPSGPNLRAPQTKQGFQRLNQPTPNWGVGGAGTPLPPMEQYINAVGKPFA